MVQEEALKRAFKSFKSAVVIFFVASNFLVAYLQFDFHKSTHIFICYFLYFSNN
jgi:hypothetical protein